MQKMKDSGVEWIGEIPEEWEITLIGNQYDERKTKVSDKDYIPLSVTKKGILLQLSTVAKSDAHDDRKLVKKGDFAINSRSDRRGSCGISAYDGSVSLINTVLTPRKEMNPKYFDWLFHSELFADEFYSRGHGIVNDLWSTNWQDMKKIAIPFPPVFTQQAIADFLDDKCAKIDQAIQKTNQSIAEYKALKQSIITKAVTKGLDENVPMKDSCVEWIDEVPADWNSIKVKYLFYSGKGLPITKENLIEDGLAVISYGQIHAKYNIGVDISDLLKRYVDFSYQNFYPSCEVKKYDFIFADTSEDYEGCGNFVYKRDNETLFAGYHTITLHSLAKQDNRYLAYLFLTDGWRKQIREKASGVKLFSITQKTLMNTSVLLPPLEEQKLIANFLDDKCAKIDKLIEVKKKILEELQTYKKSVIYEYVTGKKEAPHGAF